MKYNARNAMNKRALRNLGLCNSEKLAKLWGFTS